MAVRESLIYVGSQVTNELVREYAEPVIPTVGFPGLVKTAVGVAGLFLSDRFLAGDLKTVGYIVSAGVLARGLIEIVKGFVAPTTKAAAPTAVPTAVPPAPTPTFY